MSRDGNLADVVTAFAVLEILGDGWHPFASTERAIHRRDDYTAQAFQTSLQNAAKELWAEIVYRVPRTKEAGNLAERFKKHGASYLRFISTPDLGPTNNLAEQAIRFVVIDRNVSRESTGEIARIPAIPSGSKVS